MTEKQKTEDRDVSYSGAQLRMDREFCGDESEWKIIWDYQPGISVFEHYLGYGPRKRRYIHVESADQQNTDPFICEICNTEEYDRKKFLDHIVHCRG